LNRLHWRIQEFATVSPKASNNCQRVSIGMQMLAAAHG